MESWLFHLISIPAIFVMGRLSASVKIVGFRTKSVVGSSKRQKRVIR
ncbi:hypothetical protein NXZ84_05235 [Mechercharimyces sp. CAU 1602]|nr:hypothetical protein [Mechercharimyces sp. CAU 1602]